MEFETPECKRRIELMQHWVIEDENTGDVIGLKPEAPSEMIEEYQNYLTEINDSKPLIR